MSVLFFHTMRYKPNDPRNQCNDRFVLSKVRPSLHTGDRGGGGAYRDVRGAWPYAFLKGSISDWLPRSLAGSRCTNPVRCLGGGGLREGVRAAQPAQDRL